MMDQANRTRLSDELVRRFASALRSVQLYAPTHPIVGRNVERLCAILRQLHEENQSVAIGLIGNELVVGDTPLPKTSVALSDFIQRMQAGGIERITIDRGVDVSEVVKFSQSVAARQVDTLTLPHLRIGRIESERHGEGIAGGDVATIRRQYADAVAGAESVWNGAASEGKLDLGAARTVVDRLADAVVYNRTALVALTAMRDYDNYTFTHMVNVSILTMAQSRALGIEGRLLREFGLSALMHDIGKVNIPADILNKPDDLTDEELTLLRGHPVEGAVMLRRTPEMPVMAPIVAFEHHLRLDGSGYPRGSARPSLNLGTMLCSIADVYDAMRSQRVYQEAFPTDRILTVLKRNDGQQFDQHLVRRFVQLIGIYPPGNLVRLSSGEVAVVLRVYAPDPYRPSVRVLFDAEGGSVSTPVELDLWEHAGDPERDVTITAPLDPADYQIDPLTLL